MRRSHRVAATALGVTHVLFGLAILIGGAVRFPPPTYTPLLEFTNGHVWPYGATFLASGVLLLIHKVCSVALGCLLGAIITNLWAALFLKAVFDSPDAGATATVAYGGYALLDCVLLGLIVIQDCCGGGRANREG